MDYLIDALLERIIDLVTLGVAFVSGILITTVTFLLTYRFDWRNWLTGEFKVKIKLDHLKKTNDIIDTIDIRYELNCTNSDSFSINHIYLILPRKILGNSGYNATLGERILRVKGLFYINFDSQIFQHYYSAKHTIRDRALLEKITRKEIRTLRIGVDSSKYGVIESNSIRIHPTFFQNLFAYFKRRTLRISSDGHKFEF